MPSDADKSIPGLRERKKARTRMSIQSHALRLFRKQGYQATTIEQIIEAAEVSESTLFRYFPTKEDLVLRDDSDPIVLAAFRRRLDAQLPPILAIRRALREFFDSLTPQQRAEEHQRIALILSIPAVRARLLDQLFGATEQLADAIAQHRQLPADDLESRATAGAIVGAIIATLPALTELPDADLATLIDQALSYLQTGT